MSRTHQERRRAMYGRVGRGFWRNAHQPMAGAAESTAGATAGVPDNSADSGVTASPVHQPMIPPTPDQLPEMPESIRSAVALVVDAASRCSYKQLMERCRILSDAAMREWLREDREATEAAAKINPPEIR